MLCKRVDAGCHCVHVYVGDLHRAHSLLGGQVKSQQLVRIHSTERTRNPQEVAIRSRQIFDSSPRSNAPVAPFDDILQGGLVEKNQCSEKLNLSHLDRELSPYAEDSSCNAHIVSQREGEDLS